MSSTRRRARLRKGQPLTPSVLWDLVFLNALLAIGLVSISQMVQSVWFVLVAIAGLGIGNLIAWLSVRRRWRLWKTLLIAAASYLLAGVPLAAPTVFLSPEAAPRMLLSVVTAPVTGWKDLLTLELPLGTYQATLALPLFLTIALTLATLSLAWRSVRFWGAAAGIGLLLTVFGVLFGTSAPLGQVVTPFFLVQGVWQLIIGLGALLAAFGWIVWRLAAARNISLHLAQDASSAHLRNGSKRAAMGRWALSSGMLALAVVVGLAVTPPLVAGSTRDVLRTHVDPELVLHQQLSPLATYRDFFSEDWFDTELFTVKSTDDPGRVRLATLQYYDGTSLTTVSPSLGEESYETAFLRVPATLTADSSAQLAVEVSIAHYRGPWLPSTGSLTSIQFDGEKRAALTDTFFYHSDSATGVVLAEPGLVNGTTYSLTATDPLVPRSQVAQFTAARPGPAIDEAILPERLTEWIDLQQVSHDGAGLLELIERLQQRGYLSHALMLDEGEAASWLSDLGAYVFEPSRAGHSTDRINDLFAGLIERQEEVDQDADDALLVGAAGDDEQFAVAALMIADQLGFDARVVLGAQLSEADSDLPGTSACENGVCRGKHMTAWLEVQDAATGHWAAVPVTPQHLNPPSPETEQRSDPLNQTDVDPERIDTVPPPEPNPTEGEASDDEREADELDLSALWNALRVIGIFVLAALILTGPFIIILVAKRLRRRSREFHPEARARIAGGWAEVVDRVIDQGQPYPTTETRQEIAARIGRSSSHAAALAALADQAVFSGRATSDEDATAYWHLVDAEKSQLSEGLTRWARVRAALSLRSFAHGFRQARRAATAVAESEARTGTDSRPHFRMSGSGQ